MAPDPEHPALEALRARLAEEEAAYAEVLAAIDRLSAFTLPAEAAPEIRERLARLNDALARAAAARRAAGSGGILRQQAWDAVAPALERQQAFNAALVQLLNAYLTQTDALHARLRELAGALVRYAQRVRAGRGRARPRRHRPRHHALRAAARGLRPAARVARRGGSTALAAPGRARG